MNELIGFIRPIERWLRANSKTNDSYLLKQSILKHYYCLSKNTQISLIAKQHRVTRQYVFQMVNQFKVFVNYDAKSRLSRLSEQYEHRLAELTGSMPLPLTKVLQDFKKKNYIPGKMSINHFQCLLSRLAIKFHILEVWQQPFVIATATFPNAEQWISLLKETQKKMAYQLKRRLIVSVTQLAKILNCDPSLIALIAGHSQQFIGYQSYLIYHWPRQKRKTELSYLIAKIFTLYQKLSTQSLVKILRTPTRILVDSDYLKKLPDELLLTGLLIGGLVQRQDGYLIVKGEDLVTGNANCLTRSERGVIAVLNKTQRLQARHIAMLAKQRNWDRGSHSSLIKSPLLNKTDDGWFQLYPYPQHLIKTPLNPTERQLDRQ